MAIYSVGQKPGSFPQNGVYYFENTGQRDSKTGAEVFKPAQRLSDGANDITPSCDITPSWTAGKLRVLGPGVEYPEFLQSDLKKKTPLPIDLQSIHTTSGRIRGNQWSYTDFDGDSTDDLIVGVGDWTDYGWDNAYAKNGRWTNGPLHGFVYIFRNKGINEKPEYETPFRLQADGRGIDVYGMPSPVFGDFRGTGKLDLICGEFVDGLTFFENIGPREQPGVSPPL